jgi:two-component system phosphate regulon sensor histidine kinase PhoR
MSPNANPIRRSRLPWRAVVAGSAGAGALLFLAITGQANRGSAVLLALIVGGLTLYLSLRGYRERRFDQASVDRLVQSRPQEAQTPFSEILESLPDPVMVIAAQEADDLAGRRFIFANSAAREFFRIQSSGALLVTAIRNPKILEVVDEALFGGVPGEAAYDSGGAQDRYLRALTRPLPVRPDGSHVALLMMRDETDARRNERMRADFLANASHELRTPLASLTGFIETLRGHAKDDPVARDRFLNIMATQADRMARLIDDLLSLSRIELNEHIAPDGCVDLTQAVSDVIDALSPLSAETGVQIQTAMPPRGEALVVGDRDQIVQVVQNLIDNAVKYSRGRDGSVSGSVIVECGVGVSGDAALALRKPSASRLSLLTPDQTGEEIYVYLRINDSGPGIRREYLPRLAERFYRIEGQKSGERSGTGLGLAIVKHIMNRHRGGLAVESLEGEGAAFIVYFPIHSKALAARQARVL